MSLGTAEDDSGSEIHIPAEIDWHMLDKSKFFFLGAALFSGVSFTLYPMVVLKTRQQVSSSRFSCFNMSCAIMRYEGLRGFYKGFGTSLMGTIPARALYMWSLEVTKSNVGTAFLELGFSETTAVAVANAAAGVTSAMAAQLVWTPVDVVSQRLMVQGSGGSKTILANLNSESYRNGFDAFRKILCADGARGFYRGFGISILTYAPSNAVWWTSYSMVHRLIWSAFGSYLSKGKSESNDNLSGVRPNSKTMVAVQGLSAVMASGVSAIVTMPLDTIKTRLQVLDNEEHGRRRPLTFVQTVRNLVKEGGLPACYRGLGPRWASMSLSATTMITTYEFLKRMSTKSQ
ncbi:solute carrier family 25 member 44 [Vigna radiata var. radiata]|uniref:Solute carrier family 25 member 44 n=1 Tax=Vigna radiata var. radiata TaxID=3916 RepID=A0A1S3U1B3_VIGRR|nr:solute carrier family 25 member 44 [Vigna radiata var. radiata]